MKPSLFFETFDPTMLNLFDYFPIPEFTNDNFIIYGPSGSAKSSFAFYFIQYFFARKNTPIKDISAFKFNSFFFDFNFSFYFYHSFFIFDFSIFFFSKHLWHDVFLHILDYLEHNKVKNFFFICNNFHCIHNELLETFHHYFSYKEIGETKIHFLFLTESISFLPSPILDNANILSMPKLHKNVNNLKDIFHNHDTFFQINEEAVKKQLTTHFDFQKSFIWKDNRQFTRDKLYDYLVYNQNVFDVFWEIFESNGDVDIAFFNYIFFVLFNHYRTFFSLETYSFFFHKQKQHKIKKIKSISSTTATI